MATWNGTEREIDEGFAQYVLDTVGRKRFIENFDKPVEEWRLTPLQRRKIQAYPHGIVDEKDGERRYAGGMIPWTTLRCACGERFEARLMSQAHRLHDAHIGTHFTAADRRKIKAEEMSS